MMDYLLDTCVLSEFTRRKPEEKVIRWLDSLAEERLFISVITVGEIQHGIERLPASTRKNELQTWMNDRLIARFGERILAHAKLIQKFVFQDVAGMGVFKFLRHLVS